MGASALSAAVVVLLGFAPWSTVLPLGGNGAVLAHVFTLMAAFHGAGQLLARLTGTSRVHPMLAIQGGIAALVGLSGFAMLAHLDRTTVQVVMVTGFAFAHTVVVVWRFHEYRERVDELMMGGRPWLVPVGLLALLGTLHVLGSAGALGARPFDDDGNVIAQLQRLRETGTLGDAIGYARGSQLGGQLALQALATIPGDVHLVRALESIAFVLALGLVLARLRVRDETSALWALIVTVALAALPMATQDPMTCWTAVGLVLALHIMLSDEGRPRVAIGVVAGALITLRFELAPIGVAAAISACWPYRRDLRRALPVLAAVLAVVLPYVILRAAAWSSSASAGHSLVLPSSGSLVVKAGVFVGVLAACVPVVLWIARERGLRWFAISAAFVIAGIASELTGQRAYGVRFFWPLAIAGALLLVTELVRSRKLSTAALLVSLLACVVISEGRAATGGQRWTRRYLDLADNIEYLSHAGDEAPVEEGYSLLIGQIPAGATVAVWVSRPERLPYSELRIIDLRTPRSARLRTHGWDSHPSRIGELAAAAHAEFLLIETDDKRFDRIQQSYLYRFLCTTPRTACADDLEMLAFGDRVIAEHEGVRLIRLGAADER